MKKQFFIITITLVFITIELCGCTQQNTTPQGTTTEQLQYLKTAPTTESIQTIMEKSETIDSIYYEITGFINSSEFGSQTATIKIWQKKPFLKEEITGVFEGVTTTISMIQRPEGTYIYDASKGQYVLKTIIKPLTTPLITALQFLDIELIKEYLINQTFMSLETVAIDEKTATIIQYSPSLGDNLMTIKMWIWNEKGVPLKADIDMAFEGKTMKIDFVYNNYSFSEISDTTFSIS